MNGKAVHQTESLKFLGLTLDRKLLWDDHIEVTCKKVTSGIFLLRLLSSDCTPEVLRMAYFGLVQTHISYGIIFWGNCAATKIYRLQILQKSAIRILLKLKFRESCRDAFKSARILTIVSLYIYETMTFCFEKLKSAQTLHSYDTRSRNLQNFDSHRLELFNKLPIQAGKKLFNKLPENIRNIDNIKQFKITLKNFLIANSFYTITEFMEYSQSN